MTRSAAFTARGRKLGANLDLALELLNDLVAGGQEYPDAHWRAIRRFGLTRAEGDELQRLYDQQG